MIVVSDTSVITALIQIGRVNMLEATVDVRAGALGEDREFHQG